LAPFISHSPKESLGSVPLYEFVLNVFRFLGSGSTSVRPLVFEAADRLYRSSRFRPLSWFSRSPYLFPKWVLYASFRSKLFFRQPPVLSRREERLSSVFYSLWPQRKRSLRSCSSLLYPQTKNLRAKVGKTRLTLYSVLASRSWVAVGDGSGGAARLQRPVLCSPLALAFLHSEAFICSLSDYYSLMLLAPVVFMLSSFSFFLFLFWRHAP